MVVIVYGSKKGFQLSINVIIVIILGLVLLGLGFSIFSNAFSKATELRDQVGEDTQQQINSLLEDGSLVVVPYANKEADRGDYVDFNLGINNEMGGPRTFKVIVTYGGSTAFDENDPFMTDMMEDGLFLENDGDKIGSCGYDLSDSSDSQSRDSEELPGECGDNWVLMGKDTLTIKNNEHAYVPLRIVVPDEGVKAGQYIFNVDVCENSVDDDGPAVCHQADDGSIKNRYDSRYKLYVQI